MVALQLVLRSCVWPIRLFEMFLERLLAHMYVYQQHTNNNEHEQRTDARWTVVSYIYVFSSSLERVKNTQHVTLTKTIFYL